MLEHIMETGYNFTSGIYESTPALNIEELLQEQPWRKTGRLSKEHKRDIAEGLKFLNLVMQGAKSVQQAINQGIVSGDADAVDAYDATQKALTRYLSNHPELTFEIAIKKSKRVLQALLDLKGSRNLKTSNRDLKLTHDIFLSLSQEPQRDDYFFHTVDKNDK